jgi:hypothetical protein
MKSYIFLALLVLTACGPHVVAPIVPDLPNSNLVPGSLAVDSHLTTFYEAFVYDANQQVYTLPNAGLTLQLSTTLDSQTVSQCTPATLTTAAEIQINATYWEQLDANNQENLVFHELGSCFLGRSNRMDLNNSIPLSVMYPSLIPSAEYLANHAQYVYELFNQQDLTSSLPLVI